VLRDALGVNRAAAGLLLEEEEEEEEAASFLGGGAAEDSASVFGGSSVALSARALSSSVALSLASLPAPKHEYEASAPELPEGFFSEEELAAEASGSRGGAMDSRLRDASYAGSSARLPDASVLAAAAAEQQALELQRQLARRSAVLRHVPALPRPLLLDEEAIAPPVGSSSSSSSSSGPAQALRFAQAMISDEALLLLKADAVKFPVSRLL
jgi:hypothetical protein